jgi:hypothetical protein
MKYIYFDAGSGLSGDMLLGALLDLGVSRRLFRQAMDDLGLPVELKIGETKRNSLRALKVDVVVKRRTPAERTWPDIEALISQSRFSDSVKKNSLSVFRRLFEAEARVHGRKFRDTHLHEAGADDALVDVVGCAYLAECLKVRAFYCSPLNVGSGWVKTSHGVLPVPPPAVAELLKGAPVYSAWAEEELVTPTGAAIVSTLVRKFSTLPELRYEKIGYGAGSKDFPRLANILRAFYGDARGFREGKKVYLIEATIDDSSPQVLAQFIDTALEHGALDAYLAPVVMKKNRLATKLSILGEDDTLDILIRAVFLETSTIGVRYHPVERRVLERTIEAVKVLGLPVGIKVSCLEGREVNVQPEYADCRKAALKSGRPLKEIIHLALREYMRRRG